MVWGNREEKAYNKGKRNERERAEHTSSLARTLGRAVRSQDVALEHVRAGFRQGYGGAGDLDGVEILILVRRQGRVQICHQRRDGDLFTNRVGGLEQVAHGFVDEIGAVTGNNQSPV